MDDFSILLYDKLRGPKDVSRQNLVCSPLSIKCALDMMAAGAKGSTLQAFEDIEALSPHSPHHDIDSNKMTVSNAMFVREWAKLKPEYRSFLEEKFEAKVSQVASDIDCASLCKEINNWCNERTKGMIREMAEPSDVAKDIAIVLLNAVWFKDRWKEAFDKNLTRVAMFWTSPGKSVEILFMNKTLYLPYCDFGFAQMVKIPYMGPFSMFVILPKDFEVTEDAMAGFLFNDWEKQLKTQAVRLSIPKFSLTTTIALNEAIKQLGLGIIFDKYKADFHGMCSKEDVPFLWVSKVKQKAKIDVDEEGTEAAAVTMAGFSGYSGGSNYKVISFKVNRPFMFVIQHNEIPTALFMGRVVNL